MKNKQRKWKQVLLFSVMTVMVLTGVLLYLAFARFYFPAHEVWSFAQLQRDYEVNIEFNGHPQIIGHRGSGLSSSVGDFLIGNTKTAVANGIEAGVDWIEIDIRTSSDGHLLVFHDEKLDAKTNGTGDIASISLGNLKPITVNVDPPENISTLNDMFGEFHLKNKKWILDIKVTGIHEKVLQWIDTKISQGQLSADQIAIYGTYEVLRDYKGSGYPLGYTVIWGDAANRLRVLFQPSKIMENCQFLECDYLVLPVIFASRELIGNAHSNQLEVWVYGVEDERDFKYLAKDGVNGFIVDFPEKFTLKNNSRKSSSSHKRGSM